MSFTNTFKALSHPVRREILDLLKMGKMSAGEIADQFELTGATISHHLNVLKQADLVVETREKNFIYYELNTSVLEDMMVWLADLKENKRDENE
ncbi:autorepressor SdpR family transcription factor [Streptococcus sp. KHUD_010]|uniref:Autorepressor SdpR family transcription factor n=2 Tax=Streptococcus TaxID=1301 RepID=A0AAU7PWC5_9STRE|nr:MULTISPECIES: autorepressor SdpR family transcription factor [Streptococcus]MBC5617931.1 winged helix-turn-helix transcriptional regulator [Streptococcus hominis]QOG25152.1 winged helix-turn-helix transcriptional regulator [Streptococcus sp. KS 6]